MNIDLKKIVAQNRCGKPIAMPSFCTANDRVLQIIAHFAAQNRLPALIEATCNQVNQFGGYTGRTPADYASSIRKIVSDAGMPAKNLILGGDHLGPNPWRHLDADNAMQNAKVLVKDYVEAGFTKLHLDTSMACGQEPTPSFELVAKRSAELCVVAEKFAPDASMLIYVIGTEVPAPGGKSDDSSGIQVTTPDGLAETIVTHQAAFGAAGVPQGIEKTIAVVVHSGVDFSHDNIFRYDRAKVADLTAAIKGYENFGFEAHSTDYQSTRDLLHLVTDHSVILKVGPELTFRFREGVIALDQIEAELSFSFPASIRTSILQVMAEEPAYWKNHYSGSDDHIEFLKIYSFSDRIRYYWDRPAVLAALEQLIVNLASVGVTSALASQYGMTFPVANARLHPNEIISQRVQTTVERYYRAGGWIK